jgi:predicted regulator of Ras-like GTPase activity (Roadblock/LC7/MglB family)
VTGAASWSFHEEDARRIQQLLAAFLADSGARTAMIVDRTGQLVATVGEAPVFDATVFATLTAADFSANDQLARMLGEPEFGALFHQGERESMYLADVARRVILVVLFDTRTTLGLVKLKVRPTVLALTGAFNEMFAREQASPARPAVETGLAAEAEDEIDRLFGP